MGEFNMFKILKVIFLIEFLCFVSVGLVSAASADNNNIYSSYMVKALSETGKHEILLSAIKESGLEKLFGSDSKVPRTLYAPTDAAFKKLPQTLSDEFFVKNNKNAIVKLLLNHVFAGMYSDESLTSDQTVNLDGKILKINRDNDLFVKDMVKTEKDIMVNNGVIHSIECVMFVQPSIEDKRLDLETRNKFSITSCCMQTDLEVEAFLSDI